MSPGTRAGCRVFTAAVFATLPSTSGMASAYDGRPDLGLAARRALAHFDGVGLRSWDEYVARSRPRPASDDRRARALAMVRPQDVIDPTPRQRAKLESLGAVLAHLAPDSAIQVRVLRLDVAWAGYLDGAAVLVTSAALETLTAAELQAVVAHEVAHGFFAREYDDARAKGDYETVRDVELRCDAVAILTLAHLDGDRDSLLSGVEKLTAFNERRGVRNSPDLSPSLTERRELSRLLARRAR